MEAKKPMAEANKISALLRVALAENERFPLDVKSVALELSHVRQGDPPIVAVDPLDIDGIEGVLARHPTRKKWKIGYNSTIRSPGRIRFTLAHEFGHYVLHREMRDAFECSTDNMHEWDKRDIEAEANVFASYLLMPLDDFRAQIGGQPPSIDMLRHCSDRYGVSLMAAALKWTEVASKRAVVVAARDGFVLWARSNPGAYRSGVYLASKKRTISVPSTSLIHRAKPGEGPITSRLKANQWFPQEPNDVELVEHAFAMDGDYPYTLGMLLLPDAVPRWELSEDQLLVPVHEALRIRD